MTEGSTLRIRSAEEIARTGATLDEVDKWMDHHMQGNWFTSELLGLISKADEKNKAKLAASFPDEWNIWWSWYHREAVVKSKFTEQEND